MSRTCVVLENSAQVNRTYTAEGLRLVSWWGQPVMASSVECFICYLQGVHWTVAAGVKEDVTRKTCWNCDKLSKLGFKVAEILVDKGVHAAANLNLQDVFAGSGSYQKLKALIGEFGAFVRNVYNLLSCLITGACLCSPPEDERRCYWLISQQPPAVSINSPVTSPILHWEIHFLLWFVHISSHRYQDTYK